MTDYQIVFEQEESASAQLVRDRLDLHNAAATGEPTFYPVHYFLRNDRGETMGGLLASVWGGWLHITYLWVDKTARGKRWATQLMDRAEAYARERGAHSATLDTHSFQARPFYERRGYEVFGTLDAYPGEHKKFFLRKRL